MVGNGTLGKSESEVVQERENTWGTHVEREKYVTGVPKEISRADRIKNVSGISYLTKHQR